MIEVTAGVPEGSRSQITHLDVHRLACYLLEPASARDHRLQAKPFSVWPPLEVDSGHSGVDVVALRLNWLVSDPPPLEALQDRLERTPHLGPSVPLAPLGVDVEEVSFVELCGGDGAQSCSVDFLSPTVFARNGRRYPLPDPMLVHRGLARRWNLVAGAADPALCISDDEVADLLAAVVLERCAISTAVTRSPVEQVGFLGEVDFALTPGAGRATAAVFASLWRFAGLAGVGKGTTYGLGAVEVRFA